MRGAARDQSTVEGLERDVRRHRAASRPATAEQHPAALTVEALADARVRRSAAPPERERPALEARASSSGSKPPSRDRPAVAGVYGPEEAEPGGAEHDDRLSRACRPRCRTSGRAGMASPRRGRRAITAWTSDSGAIERAATCQAPGREARVIEADRPPARAKQAPRALRSGLLHRDIGRVDRAAVLAQHAPPPEIRRAARCESSVRFRSSSVGQRDRVAL